MNNPKSDSDLDRIMQLVAERAQLMTSATGAAVEIAEGDKMVYRAASGSVSPFYGLKLDIASSLSGKCVQTGEMLYCEDSETDDRVDKEACRKVGARSMAVVPLKYDSRTVGVLKVLSTKPNAFSNRDIEIVEQMSQIIAAAMASTMQLEQTKLLQIETEKKNQELIESQQTADRVFSSITKEILGKTLDEKYRLDAKIGSGGFAAVYQATHLELNRLVAVKVFQPVNDNTSVTALERFRREGISTCKVNHPNAISIFDSGVSDDGVAYLVMELLKGYSLADELQNKGRLSIERSLEILIPVCNVLAEAHQAKIIHRDIKPENIFLHQTKEGEIVKVLDFGIAKFMDDPSKDKERLTVTGGIIGTPTYMSPERLCNKPYDEQSDIYSLGILMYQMLGGCLPYDLLDMGLAQLMIAHIREEPIPLREVVPDIPVTLEALVMQTLEKDAGKRPTAERLAQELKALS